MRKLICDKCSGDEFKEYFVVDCIPVKHLVTCNNCAKRYEYEDPWHITKQRLVVREEAE